MSARTRLAPLPPEALDADARALYDAVLASPRGQGGAREHRVVEGARVGVEGLGGKRREPRSGAHS